MRTPPDPRSQRGTAAVEFALVLPLVLVVALALVQTGLLVRDRLLVEAAAPAVQEDSSAIRSAALAAAPSLDESGVDLGVVRMGARGEPVTVSIRYLASVRVPFVEWLFGASVVMTTSTTARQEFG
jgi:hypothetical protein